MTTRKPITPEEAVAYMERRRELARSYYARVRKEARLYREGRAAVDAPSKNTGSTGGTT